MNPNSIINVRNCARDPIYIIKNSYIHINNNDGHLNRINTYAKTYG